MAVRGESRPGHQHVCCGWTNRGVALGDGKVYLGQLDGKLVALDQKTGKVVWSTQVGNWQNGLHDHERAALLRRARDTGISGGEFGIRGRVTAFDAKTGREDWRFYTIPGPGEVGHDTWPADNDAWKYGGAAVWQTPAVDPELGLLYFSTGNTSPDLDGSKRAGDNLFAASIVALDAKTGKYRWHYQEVHHDIWDYDAPSPVVLFDVEVERWYRTRHALAEGGQDRLGLNLHWTNGKPLRYHTERPVPQSADPSHRQDAPFPSNPPVIAQKVTDANFVRRAGGCSEFRTKRLKPVKALTIFTSVLMERSPWSCRTRWRTNWPPMSWQPTPTQLL